MFGLAEWKDPLIIASNLEIKYKDEWIFLHSSLMQKGFSRYSIIAFNPIEKISGDNFAELKKKLIQNMLTELLPVR